MIHEILLWTSSILGFSFLVPYMIPSFRSTLKQIYENKRTNNVFGGDCISDIQQNQIDAIDRTVGQLVSSLCQSVIVLWALSNLFFNGSIDSLHNLVISYYIYDSIHLFIKPYGKTQKVFYIHHGLCITLILYNAFVPIGYTTIINIIYILMELSALSINLSNVQRYVYPASRLTLQVSLANIIIYSTTRMVLYPITMIYMINDIFESDRTDKYIFIVPVSFFIVMSLAFCWWSVGIIDKHRRLGRKMIL